MAWLCRGLQTLQVPVNMLHHNRRHSHGQWAYGCYMLSLGM
jgi:hypothetical protein